MKKKILAITLSLCLVATSAFAGFGDSGAFGSMGNYLKRVGTNILPAVTATYNLGSASKTWNTIYAAAMMVTSFVVSGSIDWSGGNVIYVPLAGSIEAYHDAATAGDTLVLASGTYTITDDIDITKAINIVGQGVGKTTISCATASKNVFDVGASNVRIADLSITNTSCNGIVTSNNLTGLVFENIALTPTSNSTGEAIGIKILGSVATIRDVTSITDSGNRLSIGITVQNDSSTTIATLVDCYNVRSFTNNGGGAAGRDNYAFYAYNNNDADNVTLNLYDCIGGATLPTSALGYAVYATSLTTNTAAVNVYGGSYSGGSFDAIQTGTNTLTLYDCTLVNNTTSGTITYGTNNSTFKGGNIYYASINDDIDALIASSKITAGDTIVLASGTYTVTDDIDITKAINIVGQGVGKTTVACATASKNVFDISVSNVRIANMTITNTGGTATGISIQNNLSGIVLEKLDITVSGAGSNVGISCLGSSANILNVKITSSSSDSYAICLTPNNSSTTTQNMTVNVYDSSFSSTGSASIGSVPINVNNVNDANTITANFYNVYSVGNTSGGTADSGLRVTSTTTFNSTANAYGCTFSGADYDVVQTGTNVLTLYDCTLVNGTTSGTITYAGTVATANAKLPTTASGSTDGVVYKGSNPFIHNYQGSGGAATPVGFNTFVGESAGNLTLGNTATATYEGSANTGVGSSSLQALTLGRRNSAVGYLSLFGLTTGGDNVALGYQAGRYYTGDLANTTSTTSVYLGYNTRAFANGDANEIVIGYDATGAGSNTVTLGNTSVTKTVLRGAVVNTPDEITATSEGVAASVNTFATEITTNGDSDLDNVTLANGVSGQIKHFVWTVAGNAADTMKITPATTCGTWTQITFDAGDVGTGCTMIYSDSEGWSVIGNNGGTIA